MAYTYPAFAARALPSTRTIRARVNQQASDGYITKPANDYHFSFGLLAAITSWSVFSLQSLCLQVVESRLYWPSITVYESRPFRGRLRTKAADTWNHGRLTTLSTQANQTWKGAPYYTGQRSGMLRYLGGGKAHTRVPFPKYRDLILLGWALCYYSVSWHFSTSYITSSCCYTEYSGMLQSLRHSGTLC